MTSPHLPITGRPLVAGTATGRALVLRAPLNLWSGLDPVGGVITDRGHPDRGAVVTGRVLVIPALSGATGGASITESLRLGTGPAAVVVTAGDPTLVLAAALARELYQVLCPVVQVRPTDVPALHGGVEVVIHADGRIDSSGLPTPTSSPSRAPSSSPAPALADGGDRR